MRLLQTLILAVSIASLGACGSSGSSVKDGGEGGSGAEGSGGEGGGKTADGKTGDGRRHLDEDEFKVREVEAVKAPTYLPNIDKKAQDDFRRGVQAVLAKNADYKKGAEYFRKAVDKDSKFLEAYFNLGMALERMGKRDEALEVYNGALTANPDDPTAGAYIAKIYLGKGRSAELLGNAQEAEQWNTKAINLLKPLQAKEPKNTAVNNALALYHLAKGDLDTSERFVKEVLYAEPRNVTALNTRGLINLKRDKLLIAKWIFENKVLKFDPNSTEALTNLGYTYIKLDVRPLAMKFFKRALAEDPSNMDVRMNIAAMLLEHLNYEEANKHYTKVLEVEPNNLDAKEGQCDSAYGMGGTSDDSKKQFKAAIACYLEFVEKKPSRTDLYERVAQTYQVKLQDLENAVKYFEIYMAKADLKPDEKQKVVGTVKVLKDIIAKGGLKAMMAPPPEENPDGGDGAAPEGGTDGTTEDGGAAKPAPEGGDAATPPAEGDKPADKPAEGDGTPVSESAP